MREAGDSPDRPRVADHDREDTRILDPGMLEDGRDRRATEEYGRSGLALTRDHLGVQVDRHERDIYQGRRAGERPAALAVPDDDEVVPELGRTPAAWWHLPAFRNRGRGRCETRPSIPGPADIAKGATIMVLTATARKSAMLSPE